ncbi:DUF4233 domain-containing protein [Nonomuraea phyllanthi]|uniref:DUF4233 domain-containing protein n=1 Tax=Nonomuraea phyllanthi TaxID=2219224 RepID=A0A5C4VLM4_9ACTN|nr:DUF4233 domain-containing protein [Nonomuraea phyllanthi]KAB8189299.1 DUF4233 domain-containing protein [Nonomuraea phyllanthi]QFY11789.1 DUF4233 domain-containing protein [Nonomuraea phyllanthi]
MNFQVTPGMRRLGASVLGMEAIVAGLITPVAIAVGGVAPGLAVTAGIGLAVLCVVAAGLLKKPFGYILGSVVQVLAICTGFLVPTMFFLGVIFTALWITAIVVARRVEGATFR